MIAINRVSPESMAAAHNRVAAARVAKDQGPAFVNAGPAREIWQPRPLYYRGRKIAPRPISWEEGLALLETAAELEQWARSKGEDLVHLRRLYRRLVDLCWMCARPRGMPRWVQRLRRNPFRRATEQELQELLRFFGRCRTISLVGYRS